MIRNIALPLSMAGIILFFVSSSVFGLTMTEPKPGAVFHAGDNVSVKLQLGPGENPVVVFCLALHMPFSKMSVYPPYEFAFTIPADFTGEDTIVAEAKLSDGTIVEAKSQIQVVLPSNITLQGISVDPTFIFLQKMPSGSSSNDIRIAETRSIGVGGLYSDGVKRGITASSSGTIYTSSNEKVVTVSPEGKVTARGLGTAKITVRNGKFTATVDVIVEAYKP